MAVVNEKKKQDPAYLATGQQTGTQLNQNAAGVNYQKKTGAENAKPKVNPYAGLSGVSANTAQQLGNAQTGYHSQYTEMMNNIMQQIMNPQAFNYEFNADPLFQAYADMYTQQGRQASLDAQGQAAQLTGGYGNSYGAAVGNQAYQQYLTKLYDKGLDLRDRAYQMYSDDWNKLLNQYGVVNEQDQQGYNQWLNNLNYWTGMAQTENTGHYQDQSYAWQLCQAILANGQMPSAALLAAAGLSAEDAAKMMAIIEAGGGGGGPSGTSDTGKPNNQLTGTPYNVATSEVQANSLGHNQDFVSTVQQNLQNMPSALQQSILQAAQNTLQNANTSQAVQNLINATTSGVQANTGLQGKPNIGTYYGWSSSKKKKE